jgi:hypothetical protein
MDEKKTPDKRGRKSNKKKVEENKVVHKKRGRKPKNNIIVNDNPEFDGNYDEDITVKLHINENKEIKNDVFNSNIYKKDNYEIIPINDVSVCSKICWNCSHPLQNKRGMPIKYIKDIFYTYGDFCSDQCCLRYAYDTYDDSMYFIILSNLELKRKIDNIDNKSQLQLPPSKYLLDIYGGPLTIQEYLKSNESYKIELSNCIHLNHVFNKNDCRIKNTDKVIGELKLYRKNTVFKNDVISYYQ